MLADSSTVPEYVVFHRRELERSTDGHPISRKFAYSLSVPASEIIGVIARMAIGAALVSAGVFKLLDGRAWPKQAADMGVGRPIALVVPWIEISIGIAVASQLLRPWPAVAAGLLLLAFTALIWLRLREGSRPPCACFGSRSARPLGTYHLIRNGVLLALTAAAIISS